MDGLVSAAMAKATAALLDAELTLADRVMSYDAKIAAGRGDGHPAPPAVRHPALRRLGARDRAGNRHHADRALLRAVRRPRGVGGSPGDLPGHRRDAAAGGAADRVHGDRARDVRASPPGS